ncbi:MAG TPA: DUF6319 family protein [Pseudonocardiaceae bacterium]|jgi:hypothetical protein|nr:DUF6319 family protein [Pseudonocardiaceae bacterium]
MPPPKSKSTPAPTPLTADQIDHLRTELDAGRLPAVWFTPAAVGVDAGRSAKVVAFTDPAEGDFIQVRPTGSADVISFGPSELTVERPPRRRKGAEPPANARTGSTARPAAPTAIPATPASPLKPSASKQSAPPPKATDELLVTRERPTRPTRPGRTRQPSPVTVTLSSTPDGEWTIDVLTGKKRAVRPQPIAASAVAEAARALGPDVAEAIDSVLAAARDRQRDRVAELEAELASARRALAQLAEG